MAEHYTLTVNGRSHEVRDASITESLLFVLRERLGFYGTKGACEQGECGSCSVLIDGELVCSCLMPAATQVGRDVRTVEGLGDGTLTDIQRAFVDHGAVQCGFCTPGLVMAAHALLDRIERPTEMQVREELSGNLCRCTGYGRLIDAVLDVARQRSEGVGRG